MLEFKSFQKYKFKPIVKELLVKTYNQSYKVKNDLPNRKLYQKYFDYEFDYDLIEKSLNSNLRNYNKNRFMFLLASNISDSDMSSFEDLCNFSKAIGDFPIINKKQYKNRQDIKDRISIKSKEEKGRRNQDELLFTDYIKSIRGLIDLDIINPFVKEDKDTFTIETYEGSNGKINPKYILIDKYYHIDSNFIKLYIKRLLDLKDFKHLIYEFSKTEQIIADNLIKGKLSNEIRKKYSISIFEIQKVKDMLKYNKEVNSYIDFYNLSKKELFEPRNFYVFGFPLKELYLFYSNYIFINNSETIYKRKEIPFLSTFENFIFEIGNEWHMFKKSISMFEIYSNDREKIIMKFFKDIIQHKQLSLIRKGIRKDLTDDFLWDREKKLLDKPIVYNSNKSNFLLVEHLLTQIGNEYGDTNWGLLIFEFSFKFFDLCELYTRLGDLNDKYSMFVE